MWRIEDSEDTMDFRVRVTDQEKERRSQPIKVDLRGNPVINSDAIIVQSLSGQEHYITMEISGHYIALPFVRHKKGKGS